ncbi:uncharacterized protein LOC125669248 [Ostrea edulis]|uniref:uncharacterized protein LOC125669248 n=1 Tax=Ostrea edulis TaxID=37623 RepID=UPI0024AFADB3|nr:uncharacterized protein LOC125669248 [Ostrea edulis]
MLAAMKADIPVADLLINEGAGILVEDDCHCTAVCHGFDDENGGENFVKYILGKMSQKDREAYIKNRIDRMRDMVDFIDFDDFFTESLVPVFQHLSKVEPGRDILFRDKLIPNMLSAVQKYLRHQEVVSSACNIFCSCMYQYNSLIDERFARQFLQAKGPEFCLRALKFYTESGKNDKEFMVAVFYPIVCINECKICQTWIVQNTGKIEPYTSLQDKFKTLKYHDEVLKEKGHRLWKRFWDGFDDLQRNLRNMKIKELLDEEEREKTKKSKKRERKKQRRQREKEKKTKESIENITTGMEEMESGDSHPVYMGEKTNSSVIDKDSGDYIGIHGLCNQNENLTNELADVHGVTTEMDKVEDDKETHAAMNKSANSKEGKNKIKRKGRECGAYNKVLQANWRFSEDAQHDESERNLSHQMDSWTKVTGKKSLQKTEYSKDTKRPVKKKNEVKSPLGPQKLLSSVNSESRRWSDVTCKRRPQETAYTENNVPNTRVVESVAPIQTDNLKEFPSLKQSMPGKWEDENVHRSVKSESTAELRDSDEYKVNQDPCQEIPAWVDDSKLCSTEVESDPYWIETSQFKRNVRHTAEENSFWKQHSCMSPSTGQPNQLPYDSGALVKKGTRKELEYFPTREVLDDTPYRIQQASFIKEDTQIHTHYDQNNGICSKSQKESCNDMGVIGASTPDTVELIIQADSENDMVSLDTTVATPKGRQNTFPWGKIPAPTLKDVAIQFMNNTRSEIPETRYLVHHEKEDDNKLTPVFRHPAFTYTKEEASSLKTISKKTLNRDTPININNQLFHTQQQQRAHTNEFSSFDMNIGQASRYRDLEGYAENLDIANNFPPLTKRETGDHSNVPPNVAETTEGFICSGKNHNLSSVKHCKEMSLTKLETELTKNPNGMRSDSGEMNNTKVAIIQPIGHERRMPHLGTKFVQPTESLSNSQLLVDKESALRSFLDGLQSTGIDITLGQNRYLPKNTESEKAKCELETISGNCPLGDSILRNALTIEHHQEDIAYSEELRDEKDKYACSFPGFHDAEERLVDKTQIALNRHKVELIQFIQLQNYYQQYNNPAAMETNYFHDFQYYASALGLSKQEVENMLCHEIPKVDASRIPNNVNHPVGVRARYNPENGAISHQPLSSSTDTRNYPEKHQHRHPKDVVGKETNSTVEDWMNTRMEDTLVNFERKPNITFPPTPKAPVTNWHRNSFRWRSKLQEIYELPEHLRRRVGEIIFPTETEKFKIPYSDEGGVLGFLSDGSEVAIQAVDLKSRTLGKGFLETLVSDHFTQFFLVRYKSFAIEEDMCYLAMELHEYTLAEYIDRLCLTQELDPLTINKLAWQLVKGLASLHENCGVPHGNIMPSNILVDTEGRLRLSEYGFPRASTKRIQLMSNKAIFADRNCWTPTEVITESEAYSFKSDVQVAGMLICYIMSGGKHAYGENSLEITVSIQANWSKVTQQNQEMNSLLSDMLVMPSVARPEFSDILIHPYFWADEKKLRFILIVGSDVLRDIRNGIPILGAVSGTITMIDIVNSAEQDETLREWTSYVEPIVMQEMRSFRQYRSTSVELVLFIYNSCLHFDKLTAKTREIMEEPTKYFLTKFPTLFMSVFKAIKASERRERVCYKPFF